MHERKAKLLAFAILGPVVMLSAVRAGAIAGRFNTLSHDGPARSVFNDRREL
jgi:hypothetical protein